MAIFTIPILAAPTNETVQLFDFQFQIELDNETFTLSFFWNDRSNAWYMTIGDAANNIILANQRVVVNYPIGWKQKYLQNMPAGSLQFVDTSGQGLDPAVIGDLGVRVQLLYLDAAEVASQLADGPTNVSG